MNALQPGWTYVSRLFHHTASITADILNTLFLGFVRGAVRSCVPFRSDGMAKRNDMAATTGDENFVYQGGFGGLLVDLIARSMCGTRVRGSD